MDKKALGTLLRSMLENIVSPTDATPDKHPAVRYFWGDDSRAWLFSDDFPAIEIGPAENLGPSFALVGEGYDAFERFIENLRTDSQIGKRIGNQTLEKSTEKLLRAFKDNPHSSDAEFAEAIDAELKSLRDSIVVWTSFAPVDFLVLEDLSELQVGVMTLKPTAAVSEQILSEFGHRIDQVESFDASQKQQQKDQVATYFFQAFQNVATCAQVTVEAEKNGVQQLADAEVDASLNLLRCYTHVLFHRDLRVKMGLRGETGLVYRPVIGFANNDTSWNFNFQSIGLLHPFVVSSKSLELLKNNYAFDTLSETLAKPESSRSKLEKAVVTAIRWLGRGVTAFDLPEKVLHFAAASERLLTGDESPTEITEKFARRLAFLIRDDPKERLQLALRARDLYKARNKVIHAGKTDVAVEDVIEMEALTLQALVRMAQRLGEWKEHKHFTDWVDNQTFGVVAANG